MIQLWIQSVCGQLVPVRDLTRFGHDAQIIVHGWRLLRKPPAVSLEKMVSVKKRRGVFAIAVKTVTNTIKAEIIEDFKFNFEDQVWPSGQRCKQPFHMDASCSARGSGPVLQEDSSFFVFSEGEETQGWKDPRL